MERTNRSSYASTSEGEEAGPSSSHNDNSSRMGKSNKQGGSGNRTGIKRQRVHFSCTECSRRKQRCNRETPCQHCIARKIPERCRTFQPGEDPNDLNSRVSRLEESVNENFERMFSMVNTLIKKGGMNNNELDRKMPTTRSLKNSVNGLMSNEDQDASFADHAEGSEAGDSVVMFPAEEPAEKASIPTGPSMDATFDSLITESVDRQGILYRNPLLVTDPMLHIENAAQLDAVMFEFGATFSISQILKSAMPHRELFDDLIDHFFIHNNWLRQPLSRKRTMKTYDCFWENGAVLHANNTNSFATHMLIAAIGSITYRGKFQVSDDPRVIQLTAKRIYFSARQALLISTMLGKEDIQQVVAFHLAARFLFLDRRVSEAWSCVANAVRTALSIGLHRDGSMLNLPSEEIEARRRIWSIVYFGDRIICMNLGRPTAIDDDKVDTQLVDDSDPTGEFEEYMRPLPGAKIPPGERPKFLTFTCLRSKLAILMGKVVKIFQNLQSPAHYSDVVALDHEITAMHKTFPDHFRSNFDESGEVQNCNTEWDDVFEFVPVHRYLLQSELLFVRMSLNRTYLLRPAYRGSSGKGSSQHNPHHRYTYSRKSCIEAAFQTLQLRRDLSKTITSQMKQKADSTKIPEWLSHLGTYNTTSAIVILGIFLLMEPETNNAERLFKPMKDMHELHLRKRERLGGKFDDTKEREFTILRLFVERIEDAHAKGKKASTRSSKTGRNRTGSEVEVEDSQRNKKMAKIEPSNKKGNNSRHQSTHSLSHSQSADSGIGGYSADTNSKDEDTASVLLDLNQSVDTRRNSAPQSNNATETGNDKNHQSLPWPYLPMQTPQNHSIHDSPLAIGSTGSNVQNGPTPPLIAGNNANLNSANDGTGGASVLQMFETWFRYNAFEDIDSGALGSNSTNGSTDNLNSNVQSQNGTNANQSKGVNPLPPPPTIDRTSNNNSQWSTLPLPTYSGGGGGGGGSTNNVPSISQQQQGNLSTQQQSGNTFGGPNVMASIGIPPGPRNSFYSNQPEIANPSQEGQQNNISAASYDPAFWQSLIDKISN